MEKQENIITENLWNKEMEAKKIVEGVILECESFLNFFEKNQGVFEKNDLALMRSKILEVHLEFVTLLDYLSRGYFMKIGGALDVLQNSNFEKAEKDSINIHSESINLIQNIKYILGEFQSYIYKISDKKDLYESVFEEIKNGNNSDLYNNELIEIESAVKFFLENIGKFDEDLIKLAKING